jgi:hypothetical protein
MSWWFQIGLLVEGLLAIIVLGCFLDGVVGAMQTRADRKCEYHREQEEYLNS